MSCIIPSPLALLFVSMFPPSPPTFGAQRRIEGLMTALARRHRVSAISLLREGDDPAAAERAMRAYCEEVVLVPGPSHRSLSKRLVQLGALASPWSFERHHLAVPGLARALARTLRTRRFDVVSLEGPYFSHRPVRVAPPGAPPPVVLLDEHNVEYELARRSRDASAEPLRRLHHAVNWRKVRREEIAAWRRADGVAFTSAEDLARARPRLGRVPAAIIPNGVDVDHFRVPRGAEPDPATLVFFGTLDYFPNQDGVRHLLGRIWPRVAATIPGARLRIIGPHPTPEVLAQRSDRVEVTGCVEDLRPHLARATAVVVPLRVGGGTRLKILEAMAMGRPVISTSIGAEGIEARDGREILIADDPDAFASAVCRVLRDAAYGRALGDAGRALVEGRYAWSAIAADLERFLVGLVSRARGLDGLRARADPAPAGAAQA